MRNISRRSLLKMASTAAMLSALPTRTSAFNSASILADASVIKQLVPTGRLRASINVGNPILANIDPATGQPHGVSVDLACAFAQFLKVDIDLMVFNSALKSVEAVSNETADIGFFAIDPLRGQEVVFTAPYVLIEGNYLVSSDSPIRANDDVDQPGNRVVVGKGSAYDLYLSRELQYAQLVRVATSQEVVDAFVGQRLEVAAGVKQQLEADAARVSNVRLLPNNFMVIRQAMGLPRRRGARAAKVLAQFVEEMKYSGFVARALSRHGIQGASVAP